MFDCVLNMPPTIVPRCCGISQFFSQDMQMFGLIIIFECQLFNPQDVGALKVLLIKSLSCDFWFLALIFCLLQQNNI